MAVDDRLCANRLNAEPPIFRGCTSSELGLLVLMAIFICIGFLLGAYLGAHLVHTIPDTNLKKAFGVLLVIVGSKMIL